MRLRHLAETASLVAAGNLAAAGAAVLFRAILAHHFGADTATDALAAALQTTDAAAAPFMAMVGTAFIPLFVHALDRDADEAWLLARTVVVMAAAALALLAVGLAFWAAPVAAWMVGGGSDARVALAASMVPAFAVGSVLGALAGLLGGLLQAQRNFVLPAASQPVRSLTALSAVAVGGAALGVWSAVWGIVVGFALQALLVSPAIWPAFRAGRTLRPAHPAVRQVARRMAPLVVGAFAWPANQAISFHYAGLLGRGSITELVYAMSVAGVLATLIGASLADASFPRLAQDASSDDVQVVRRSVTLVVASSLVLAALAAGTLTALAPDVVSLLFGHGTFGPAEVTRTGLVLRVYGIGLPGLAFQSLLSRIFYASGRTAVPQLLLVGSLLVNAALAPVLGARFGVPGIAAASLVGYAALALALVAALDLSHGWIERGVLARAAGRAGVLAVAVGLAAAACAAAAPEASSATVEEILRLVLGGGGAAVAGALALVAFDEFGVRGYLARRVDAWTARRTNGPV